MSRIRSIKPEVAQHEKLFEVEKSTGLPIRLAFILLWTQCDKEGRFRWEPRRLKLNVLPWDNLDFESVLNALWQYGFIKKYRVSDEFVSTQSRLRYSPDTDCFGYVPSWHVHQRVRTDEAASFLPDPKSKDCVIIKFSKNADRVSDESVSAQSRTRPVELELEVEEYVLKTSIPDSPKISAPPPDPEPMPEFQAPPAEPTFDPTPSSNYSNPPTRHDIETCIYTHYPRKEGKGKGLNRLMGIVKTWEKLAEVQLALTNYLVVLEREKRPADKVKAFDEWVLNWEDYREIPEARDFTDKSQKWKRIKAKHGEGERNDQP